MRHRLWRWLDKIRPATQQDINLIWNHFAELSDPDRPAHLARITGDYLAARARAERPARHLRVVR